MAEKVKVWSGKKKIGNDKGRDQMHIWLLLVGRVIFSEEGC